VKDLSFANCKFGSAGVIPVCESLKTNQSVTNLNL